MGETIDPHYISRQIGRVRWFQYYSIYGVLNAFCLMSSNTFSVK